MNIKAAFALAALLVTALAACSGNQDTDIAPGGMTDAGSTTSAADPAMPMPAEPAPSSDTADGSGEALAFLIAVNEHEIATAEHARSKQVDGPVREYADMLHAEHSRNLSETRALSDSSGIAITDTPDAMQAKGEAQMQTMAALDGDAYEAAYVTAMVNGHTEALATIDNRLMAAAIDEPVKQHLITTRAAIVKHLDAAKQLQSNP